MAILAKRQTQAMELRLRTVCWLAGALGAAGVSGIGMGMEIEGRRCPENQLPLFATMAQNDDNDNDNDSDSDSDG